MKKFLQKLFATLLAVITICSFPDASFAINKAVTVSAVVGPVNIASQIQITSPVALDAPSIKKYIKVGTSFAVTINVKDADSPTVSYTISPSAGSVSVSSGGPVATPFSKRFIYLAPAVVPGGVNDQIITIAVIDGVSVTSRNINLYVY
jgi:hypothetical protein